MHNEVEMIQKYDEVDGELVHPEYAGRKIPCVPEWVRKLSSPLDDYQYCCLAKEVQGIFHPAFVTAAVDYIKNWPQYRQRGTSLLFIGKDITKLNMLATGIVNEIYLRYRPKSDITSVTFSPRATLPWFLRQWKKDTDASMNYYNMVHDATLVWVNEPMQVAYFDRKDAWLLHSVYDQRQWRRRPTITTMTFKRGLDDVEKHIESVLGVLTAQGLKHNTIIVKEEDVEEPA